MPLGQGGSLVLSHWRQAGWRSQLK